MGDGADDMMEREAERFFNAGDALAMLPQGYSTFADWCESEGYVLKRCSEHHWQVALDSGPLVDFWPTTNRARPFNAKKGMKASIVNAGQLRRMIAQVRAGMNQKPNQSPVPQPETASQVIGKEIAGQVAEMLTPIVGEIRDAIAKLTEAIRLRNAVAVELKPGAPLVLPPDFRSGKPTARTRPPIQIDDLETAEIKQPDVPRYHDGTAAQVGDVVKRRPEFPDALLDPGTLYTVERFPPGDSTDFYLDAVKDLSWAASRFDLVQRAPQESPVDPLAFPDGPTPDVDDPFPPATKAQSYGWAVEKLRGIAGIPGIWHEEIIQRIAGNYRELGTTRFPNIPAGLTHDDIVDRLRPSNLSVDHMRAIAEAMLDDPQCPDCKDEVEIESVEIHEGRPEECAACDPDLDEAADEFEEDWQRITRIAVQVAALHATIVTNSSASVSDIADTAYELSDAYLRRMDGVE